MAKEIDPSIVEKEVGSKVTDENDGDNRCGSTGLIYEFENGEEWLVFPDYDDAEYAATECVKDDIDDDPSMFSQDWLNGFIYVSDTDRRIIAGEESSNRVEDNEDDDMILDADMQEELDELQEKLDDDKITDEEFDNKKEKLVDKAKEEIEEKIYDEWYSGLEYPVDFLVEEQGIYSVEDLLKQSFISIDTDKAAEDAISTDGAAHFLSGYDGNQVDLDNGNVMFRIN